MYTSIMTWEIARLTL